MASSRSSKNNLDEMRKAVAKKFPQITTLSLPSRGNGAGIRGQPFGGKENNQLKSTSSMELVSLPAPEKYEFGLCSSDEIYKPSASTPLGTTTVPLGQLAFDREVQTIVVFIIAAYIIILALTRSLLF